MSLRQYTFRQSVRAAVTWRFTTSFALFISRLRVMVQNNIKSSGKYGYSCMSIPRVFNTNTALFLRCEVFTISGVALSTCIKKMAQKPKKRHLRAKYKSRTEAHAPALLLMFLMCCRVYASAFIVSNGCVSSVFMLRFHVQT